MIFTHFSMLKIIITFIYSNTSNLFLLHIGRRSRRNSTSDDSQLTIENFGGSQDQLHMIGRTLERERKVSNVIIGKSGDTTNGAFYRIIGELDKRFFWFFRAGCCSTIILS